MTDFRKMQSYADYSDRAMEKRPFQKRGDSEKPKQITSRGNFKSMMIVIILLFCGLPEAVHANKLYGETFSYDFTSEWSATISCLGNGKYTFTAYKGYTYHFTLCKSIYSGADDASEGTIKIFKNGTEIVGDGSSCPYVTLNCTSSANYELRVTVNSNIFSDRSFKVGLKEVPNYTVSYNGNGATSGSTAASSLSYGIAQNLTANGFTRTGYTFAGWATSASGGVVYSNAQSVINLTTSGATITLYAKWTPNTYTVSYNGNGNTGGSTASSTHTYDAAKNLTANGFTRTGYSFAGWATSASDGDGVAYKNEESVKNLTDTKGATKNLYAVWTVNTYTIMLDRQNGSINGNPSSVYEQYGKGWSTSSSGPFNLTDITPPTQTDCTFEGYYTSTGGGGEQIITAAGKVNVAATRFSAHTTLYAKWQPVPVPVNPDDAFKQWDKKVTLTWNYNNPSNLTGKFYIYRRQVPEAGYTLLENPIAVTSGSNQMTYTNTITETEFSKDFDYFIGFYEGNNAPVHIDSIAAANCDSVRVNTTPTHPFSVETQGNKSGIDISFIPDSRLYESGYTYQIQRSVNGAPFADWGGSYPFSQDNSNITGDSNGFTVEHNDPEPNSQCNLYKYKVIIKAFNTTFESTSDNTAVTGDTDFDEAKPFTATKGEHAGYVRLRWNVKTQVAGHAETYRVFRQLASDDPKTESAWNEMETVTSNAATVYWNDNTALTGRLSKSYVKNISIKAYLCSHKF